ncbi:MAG: hypothetical protein H7175_21190 [Burkholderiales bacterium]|nr:hypothetical protein [Anaerolineae bacterium]
MSRRSTRPRNQNVPHVSRKQAQEAAAAEDLAVAASRVPRFIREFGYGVLRLPRAVRMLIVGIFALLFTEMVRPTIDGLYLRFMFTHETRMLPALVLAAVGLGFYVLGWYLVVGLSGETPAPRRALSVYMGAGVLSLIAIAVQIVIGISIGLAPTT